MDLSFAGMSFTSLHLVLVILFLVWVGSGRFEEAVDYIEKHQLYDTALDVWKGSDRYEVCLVCSHHY